MDDAGQLLALFTNGPSITEPLKMQSARSGELFYFVDGLGSVTALADPNGNVVERVSYKAYGLPSFVDLRGPQPVYSIRSWTDSPWGFGGMTWDAEIGLHLAQRRNQDANVGRFVQEDPLGFQGGVNLYAYVLNRPTSLVDPSGTDIAVIENGPTAGNPIGHTAIAITGEGIFSSGNDTIAGSSLLDYLRREAPRRNTLIYVLKTTASQDAAALAVLKRNHRRLGIPKTFGNCSDKSNEALNAADIPHILEPYILPGSSGARAFYSGARTYFIPKGSQITAPDYLQQFEPF